MKKQFFGDSSLIVTAMPLKDVSKTSMRTSIKIK